MSRTSINLPLLTLVAAVALTAQVMPATADQAARVIALTGQVSVMHDSIPWALKLNDSIQSRQLIITGPDGFANFQVSDGSTFEVYPNSKVIFRNNPGSFKDLLDLYLGRVKVHIQKFGNLPNPNRVHTPTAVISVRGTIFDVSVDDDDDSTLVMVEEGQVAVQHALLPRGDPQLLGKDEYLRVYKDTPLAKNSVDKGGLALRALRSVQDAFYTLIYNSPKATGSPLPGGTSGGGTRLPGDTGSTPPPPPPPSTGDSGSTPAPPPPPL